MWTIWRERNAISFEDHEKLKEELKIILVKSLFNWTGAYNISYFSTFLNLWIFVLLAFSGDYFCKHPVY
jgi:accessory gene regulator protein AgrB